MHYGNIKEEELKNKVAQDYFWILDCTQIVGNIDFCVSLHDSQPKLTKQPPLLWAEAKKGIADIYKSIAQLILTIGKARTFDKTFPPAFLGAFDAEKIAFVPYSEIMDIFYQNDFNWNVAPSNHTTKEFLQVLEKVKNILDTQALIFYFGKNKNDKELKNFITENFVAGKYGITKTRIDKNNFMVIYNKWVQSVKPTIAVKWELVKQINILDGDFYLADLLSQENNTLKENLFVVLENNQYQLDRIKDEMGMFNSKIANFLDKQKAHTQFWSKYERPPKEEYWDYIIARRDLLVPQDVRERKGSFYTPQIWVELSQKYLADTLGEDWQDEYYIWDCAAGTGNLLTGLTNKLNIWASTLDKQDVEVIKDRVQNGANLLEKNVFQFDFLNDDFSKLPQNLQEIINDSEKRKKLVIYINPPYAEASDKKTLKKGTEGKTGVEQSKTNKKYAHLLGQGNAELFAQFFIRIYKEIPDCILAEFSKLKILQGHHFIDFRTHFLAKLEKLFVVPADSFDNVKGIFPIGFMIWDTKIKEKFESIVADVYDKTGIKIGEKNFESQTTNQYLNDWVKPFRADIAQNQLIGKFPFKGNDFQNQNMVQIVHHKMEYNTEAGQFFINQKNVLIACIYFAVRKCIPATWLNDRDQFLYPNKNWENDTEFHNDCLAYTLFTNNIQSQFGTNHWIPFAEKEIDAIEKFESDFMSKYIAGKVDTNVTFNLFNKVEKQNQKPLVFSAEAKVVFDAGRELWQYYHKSIKNINTFLNTKPNANASLYDIREYFQGRNTTTGRMNNKSEDETYTKLMDNLRDSLKVLAKKIEIKVYAYGFLKA
ncbi:MAG: hypothetical protein EAZ85_10295 [Bacteroidetes bacterium]|nr:MAG: hypothetical protein EAZ85_10295 [Bacteroidota bacterium]